MLIQNNIKPYNRAPIGFRAQTQEQPIQNQPPKKDNKSMYIGLGALALLGVAGGAYYFATQNPKFVPRTEEQIKASVKKLEHLLDKDSQDTLAEIGKNFDAERNVGVGLIYKGLTIHAPNIDEYHKIADELSQITGAKMQIASMDPDDVFGSIKSMTKNVENANKHFEKTKQRTLFVDDGHDFENFFSNSYLDGMYGNQFENMQPEDFLTMANKFQKAIDDGESSLFAVTFSDKPRKLPKPENPKAADALDKIDETGEIPDLPEIDPIEDGYHIYSKNFKEEGS